MASIASGRMGPRVFPAVHRGSALLVLSGALILATGIAAAIATPGASLPDSTWSDLLVALPPPSRPILQGALVLAGILAIAGIVLLPTAFPRKTARDGGLLLLVLGAAGAIGFAVIPQGSVTLAGRSVHSATAALWWGASALGLIALAWAMLRDTRWGGMRLFTLLLGLISLGAAIALYLHAYGPLGPGGLVWVVVVPCPIWFVVSGLRLFRFEVVRDAGGPAT
ncbi:MAG: DUF998 domain-containing protein [Thermoplasmata archaeon]